MATEKYLIVVSTEFESVTCHLLESFNVKLEELRAPICCDVFYTPNAMLLPWTMQRLLAEGKYQGCVAMGCFIGDVSEAEYQTVLSNCMQVTQAQRLPLLPVMIAATDLESARDQVFGPTDQLGYKAASQMVELLSLVNDLPSI